MFDIGFTELLVVGIVALIVVGPKDLPGMFRTLGRITARARALGREFTSAMNAAADESGVREASKELKGLTSPRAYGLDKLNEAADRFDNWDPTKPAKDNDAETSEKAVSAALDPERQADIDKIRAATEKAGQAKLDREAAKNAEADAPKKAVRGKPPERPKPKPKPEPKAEAETATPAEPAPTEPAPAKAKSGPAAKTSKKTTSAKAKAPAKTKSEAPAKSKAAPKTSPAKKKAPAKKAAVKAPAKSDKANDA